MFENNECEYEALNENLIIEIPREEKTHNEKGVAQVDERLVKPKIGILISKGKEVPNEYKIGSKYVLNEYAGYTIPDPNRTLIFIHFRNVGVKIK